MGLSDPIDRKLYATLEISSNASEQEIRRSYRRLALLYHPDKCAGHQGRFQEINHAHDILSNRIKRRIYDRYGTTGLTVYGAMKSEELVNLILNDRRLRTVFWLLIITLASLALLPTLITLKATHIINLQWNILLLPLWIFDMLVMIVGIYIVRLGWSMLAHQETLEEGEPVDEQVDRAAFVIGIMVLMILFFGFVVQQTLIAIKLDGWLFWSWWKVLCPYLIIESIKAAYYFVRGVFLMFKSSDNLLTQLLNAFINMRWICMRLSFLFLLLGHLDISWTIVFCPIYLILPLSILIDYLVDKYRKRFDPEISLFWYRLYLAVVVYVIATAIFVNSYLSGIISNRFVAFLPVYLLSLIAEAIIMMCGFLIYDTMVSNLKMMQEESLDHCNNQMEWLRRPGYVFASTQNYSITAGR